MNNNLHIRPAQTRDLDDLVKIEKACFQTDRMSKRSFSRFIKPGSHEMFVLLDNQTLIGYALVLYRAGTNLARLYSIAILPEYQGKGFSKLLLDAAEIAVQKQHCVFLRLEVNVNNIMAISLYEKRSYKVIGHISNYYDDGSDALRMEKRMQHVVPHKHDIKNYYQQTTEFSCGPASLMMAMKTLQPRYRMTRQEELQIWREATTIYMTTGHGGCSPHGLALSAWRRGFDVTLYINQSEAPFLDGVRSEEKKSVIQLVHEDFMKQLKDTDIKLKIRELRSEELDTLLNKGLPIIALISTWRLNRNKAPHWVYVSGSDQNFVYVNDPEIDDEEPHVSQIDYIQVPIAKNIFFDMARFGQKRLRCLLVISGPRES